MTLTLAIAALAVPGSLGGEVDEFLSFQEMQGFSAQAVQMVQLELLAPCTLAVPPLRDSLEGYLIAFGGNHTLDLWVSISDTAWVVTDTLPDDVPVLQLDPGQVSGADLVVLEARDMTHGASSDSAAVIWILRPVDRNGGGLNL